MLFPRFVNRVAFTQFSGENGGLCVRKVDREESIFGEIAQYLAELSEDGYDIKRLRKVGYSIRTEQIAMLKIIEKSMAISRKLTERLPLFRGHHF
jgi:hypothetical protein